MILQDIQEISTKARKFLENSTLRPSLFENLLIVDCLINSLDRPETSPKVTKFAQRLLTERSKHDTFNYWFRGSLNSKESPYPDDLDDTSCALAIMYKYNPELISGSILANFTKVLTSLEVGEGGPYTTWVIDKKGKDSGEWGDVDLAVNSNIAYLLDLLEIELPSLNSLVEDAIESDSLESPYYVTKYAVIYFISRFYKGHKVQDLVDLLLFERGTLGVWENPLNTAFVISALINFGYVGGELEGSILHLISCSKDGIWENYPFVVEKVTQGTPVYMGSRELTTAFVLEALSRYQKILQGRIIKNPSNKGLFTKNLHKKIMCSLFKEVPGARNAYSSMKKTLEKWRVTTFPYYVSEILCLKTPLKILLQLGEASLCGWMAYTIYDDVLDGEGEKNLVPVANVLSSRLHRICSKLGHSEALDEVLQKMERANQWEQNNCRFIPNKDLTIDLKEIPVPDFGDYSVLASKSYGHLLPVFALAPGKDTCRRLEGHYKHYLIARQLSDDAHDWEDDLKRGIINSVGALLISAYKKRYSKKGDIQLGNDLVRFFWEEVIEDVCRLINIHIKQARDFYKHPILDIGLVDLESTVSQTLNDRGIALEFLGSYLPSTAL